MRKLVGFLMALGLAVAFGACDGGDDVEPEEAPVVPPAESPAQ